MIRERETKIWSTNPKPQNSKPTQNHQASESPKLETPTFRQPETQNMLPRTQNPNFNRSPRAKMAEQYMSLRVLFTVILLFFGTPFLCLCAWIRVFYSNDLLKLFCCCFFVFQEEDGGLRDIEWDWEREKCVCNTKLLVTDSSSKLQALSHCGFEAPSQISSPWTRTRSPSLTREVSLRRGRAGKVYGLITSSEAIERGCCGEDGRVFFLQDEDKFERYNGFEREKLS